MTDFRMSEAERLAFLAEQRVGVIAIERPDAPPLAVPVWYGLTDSGAVTVWTERGTLKDRCLRAAGRFTLAVQDERPPYGYVSVAGPAEIRESVTADDIRPIVARYVPADEVESHLADAFNDRAVLVTMQPARWYTADYRKSE